MARKSLISMIANASKSECDYASEFITSYIKHIEDTALASKRPPSKNISPSGLKCSRAIVYRLLGIEQDNIPTSYNLVGIGESGSNRHEVNQQYISNMPNCEYVDVAKYVTDNKLDHLTIGEKTDFETHLYDKKNRISFLCDGIIKFKPLNGEEKTFILEIKTMTDNKYWKIKKEVPEEYRLQATCYSLLLQIPQVMFLFEARDLLQKKALIYTPSEEDKEYVLSLIYYVNECANNNTVPAKPANVSATTCGYCNWKSVCDKCEGEYSV